MGRHPKRKKELLALAYHELSEAQKMRRMGLKRAAMREMRNAHELFRMAQRVRRG